MLSTTLLSQEESLLHALLRCDVDDISDFPALTSSVSSASSSRDCGLSSKNLRTLTLFRSASSEFLKPRDRDASLTRDRDASLTDTSQFFRDTIRRGTNSGRCKLPVPLVADQKGVLRKQKVESKSVSTISSLTPASKDSIRQLRINLGVTAYSALPTELSGESFRSFPPTAWSRDEIFLNAPIQQSMSFLEGDVENRNAVAVSQRTDTATEERTKRGEPAFTPFRNDYSVDLHVGVRDAQSPPLSPNTPGVLIDIAKLRDLFAKLQYADTNGDSHSHYTGDFIGESPVSPVAVQFSRPRLLSNDSAISIFESDSDDDSKQRSRLSTITKKFRRLRHVHIRQRYLPSTNDKAVNHSLAFEESAIAGQTQFPSKHSSVIVQNTSFSSKTIVAGNLLRPKICQLALLGTLAHLIDEFCDERAVAHELNCSSRDWTARNIYYMHLINKYHIFVSTSSGYFRLLTKAFWTFVDAKMVVSSQRWHFWVQMFANMSKNYCGSSRLDSPATSRYMLFRTRVQHASALHL